MPGLQATERRELIHELNNAIHIIAMRSELAALQLRNDQPQDALESLESVIENCGRCEAISQALAAPVAAESATPS